MIRKHNLIDTIIEDAKETRLGSLISKQKEGTQLLVGELGLFFEVNKNAPEIQVLSSDKSESFLDNGHIHIYGDCGNADIIKIHENLDNLPSFIDNKFDEVDTNKLINGYLVSRSSFWKTSYVAFQNLTSAIVHSYNRVGGGEVDFESKKGYIVVDFSDFGIRKRQFKDPNSNLSDEEHQHQLLFG